jgi:hypothetical protein
MLEALADRYPSAQLTLTNSTLAELQANLTRATTMAPMGTTVPSRHQNRIHSGRSSRRRQQTQKALQAVGGVAGHWTKAVMKPADYEMCKVVRNK